MKSKDRLWILIWPILALTVIGLLLLFERSGISYRVSHGLCQTEQGGQA